MPSDLPTEKTSARPPAAPADPLLVAALAAVGPAFETWRSAVAAAADEIRGILSRRGSPAGEGSTLGAFAAGRIDLERFVGLVERGEALDVAALATLKRAGAALTAAATAPAAAQLVVRVEDGARMRDVVEAALFGLGRAFGAARVAGLARRGAFRADADGALLDGLAPRAWTKRERRVAPPLVVSVAGADLDAGALVEFLDGGAKVVLLVRGPASPAPLVRLVTPGTFVLQTTDATGLDAFARASGPAVAAVLPDAAGDAATFVHDPATGPGLARRLVVRLLPTDAPRNPVGGWSSSQQAEELAQLVALGERAAATPEPPAAGSSAAPAVPVPSSGDPAGRLAAWLLGSADAKDARG